MAAAKASVATLEQFRAKVNLADFSRRSSGFTVEVVGNRAMDDAPFAIRIEDPRTLVPPEVSPNDAQVVLVNDESCLDDGMNQINGDVATPQVQSVLNEEENLRDKSKEALIHIICLLRKEISSKERLVRKMGKDSQSNVSRLQLFISQMERKNLSKEATFKDRITKLTHQVKHLTSAIERQLQLLASKEKELKDKATMIEALRVRVESLPEIFYPGVPDLRDSGVFMIRESKRMNSGTFACIKLPVNVSFMDEKFVGIVDDDAAAAKQPNVAKRQVTVLKVLEILSNPMKTQLSDSRSQHLIWILLLKLFNRYRFKDISDQYIFRTNDVISLKPDLIIKSHRPDLQAVVGKDVPVNQVRHRDVEVVKRRCRTNEVVEDVDRRRSVQLGPRSRVSLPVDSLVRDVTAEVQLLRAALFNSTWGRGIVNENYRKDLSPITRSLPWIEDERLGAANVAVALIAMRLCKSANGTDDIAYVPFMASESAEEATPVVNSAAIASFIPGRIGGDSDGLGPQVLCPKCGESMGEEAMEGHFDQVHGLSMMTRHAPLTITSHKQQKEHPGVLWGFKVAPGRPDAFSGRDGRSEESPFIFYPDPKSPNDEKVIEVKKEEAEQSKDALIVIKCRYCPKRFTTLAGCDAHMDGKHSTLKPYGCPHMGCTACFGLKAALLYHIEFSCKYLKRNVKGAENSKPQTPTTPENLRISRRSLLRSIDNNVVDSKSLRDGISGNNTGNSNSNNNGNSISNSNSNSNKVSLTLAIQVAESSEDEGRQFQLKTRSSNRIALCKKEGSDDEDPKDPDCSGGRRGVKRKGTEAIQESTSRNLAKRRQKHPQVGFSSLLKEVVKNVYNYLQTSKIVLKKERDTTLYLRSVNFREIEDKVDTDFYKRRDEFKSDFQRFCETAIATNKSKDVTAEVARDIESYVNGELLIRDEALARLESEINPLLSDDPRAVLNHVLSSIMEEVVQTRKCASTFQKPVSRKDYYNMVKNPICLNQITHKINNGVYSTLSQFNSDFHLLYENCAYYNGRSSKFAREALEMAKAVRKATQNYIKEIPDLK